MKFHYKILVITILWKINMIIGSLQIDLKIDTPNQGPVHPASTLNYLDFVTQIKLSNYGLNVSQIRSLFFDVKACRDTMVVLASTSSMISSEPFYQILLAGDSNHDGNWKMAVSRRKDKALQQNGYESVFKTINEERYRLNCNEYRTFWVSWKEGKIKLGRVTVNGIDEIYCYKDNDPFLIREIGVMNAWGSTGKWKIPITIVDRFTGQYNKCQRNDTKANLEIVVSVQARSVIRCSAKCDLIQTCIGINYQAQGKRCELLSAGGKVLTEIPKSIAPGWQFYTKCFEKTEVCLGCLI